MGWFQLLSLVLGIAEKVTEIMEKRQMLDAGKAIQIAESLSRINIRVNAATVARDAEQQRIADGGVQLDQPDKYRRD